jgi:Ca2+-binding RTX toxin-like protein
MLLTYTADHDLFDSMPVGSTVADTFSYTLTDESGRAVRGSVTVNIAAVEDQMMLSGSRAPDSLTGSSGEDLLDGKAGNDVLYGMAGHDTLLGREGDDELNGAGGRDFLVGGKGADNLFGGSDADYFAFGKHSGHDRILDFDATVDVIHLYEGVRVYNTTSLDRDGDGTKDLLLRLKDGGSSHASVIVFGVEDLSDITIEWLDSATPASNFATTPGSAFFSDVSTALTETYGDFSGLDAMKWSFENVASFA